MIYEKISARDGEVSVGIFGGINRRIRSALGEFSDMENMGHDENPCIASVKGAKDMGFAPPAGAEFVRMIIPKRLTGEVTGFSGIVKTGGSYQICVNGESKGGQIPRFTDAVDYNGAIITFPDVKGVNYMTGETIERTSRPYMVYFENHYTGDTADTLSPRLVITGINSALAKEFSRLFPSGTEVTITGGGNNANIFPANSMDWSDVVRPVHTVVYDTATASGGANSLSIYVYVELKNAKGEKIGWPTPTNSANQTRITITHYCPEAACATVAHNRVWFCSESGEEVFASALGKPLVFTEFNNLNTDSWTASVGTPGLFTGIKAWQNRVILFKSDVIHVVYGTLPSNFGIEKTYAAGCIDGNSIAEAGGYLIWLYYDGFYAYSGSRPKRISDKLNTKYVSCRAFSDGRRYFARCVTEDGSGEFLVYDTELNIWSKLTDVEMVAGDYYNGKRYVCSSDRVFSLYEGEHGDFYAETGEMTFDSFDDKSFIYLNIRCIIKSGFLNVYTSSNNGGWVSHKGISKTGRHKLPIRYSPGDILRLRLEGSGDVCITEIMMKCGIHK